MDEERMTPGRTTDCGQCLCFFSALTLLVGSQEGRLVH